MTSGTHNPRCAVVVPTLNAGPTWRDWLDALQQQTLVPVRCLVIDSGSSDATVALARDAGVEVVSIEPQEFNHGATRQRAVDLLAGNDVEIVCFLTQDAILAAPDALERLVGAFDEPIVGVAYGRQWPRPGAGPIEIHGRQFNYPASSVLRSYADRGRLGLKTAFCSNSFAAYRLAALRAVGGFPRDVILGEDMWVAAHMLRDGWQVAYRAEAGVFHSHSYTLGQEFRRYFDIGVFHARERWLLQTFGGAGGEGGRFVRSELAYLQGHGAGIIMQALARTLLKYLAYRLGRVEGWLPLPLKRLCSMHRNYWG
jgi:rhamnosyltransferase